MQSQSHQRLATGGQQSSASSVDKFDAIHQCANALFEQQTRCLTRTAEMHETAQVLRSRDQELHHRHRALQQLAAQLDAEVTICTQRNTERKAALAELDQSVHNVHTQHVQLQRAAQRADGVAHVVGQFVTSEVEDPSGVIPTFLATASEVLSGSTAAELRQATQELRRLQMRSSQLSQDVRGAMEVGASDDGCDAGTGAVCAGRVVDEMAANFANFAHAWAARHASGNIPQAIRRLLHSERDGAGSLVQILESFHNMTAHCTSSQSISEDLTQLEALLRSPRLECAEWQGECSASFERLSVRLEGLHTRDLPNVAQEADARGLRLPRMLQALRLHTPADSPDLEATQPLPPCALSSWPFSDVLQRVVHLDAERQRVQQMGDETRGLSDALQSAAHAATAAAAALQAAQATHADASERCAQKAALLQSAQQRVSAAMDAQTMCAEATRRLSIEHDQTLAAEDATIDRALAELQSLLVPSFDDWGVARALDWEFCKVQEAHHALHNQLEAVDAKLERAKTCYDEATNANEVLTAVAERLAMCVGAAVAPTDTDGGAAPAAQPFDASLLRAVAVPPAVAAIISQALRDDGFTIPRDVADPMMVALHDASSTAVLDQGRRSVQTLSTSCSALGADVLALQGTCDALRRENVRLTEALAAMQASG